MYFVKKKARQKCGITLSVGSCFFSYSCQSLFIWNGISEIRRMEFNHKGKTVNGHLY